MRRGIKHLRMELGKIKLYVYIYIMFIKRLRDIPGYRGGVWDLLIKTRLSNCYLKVEHS